MKFIHIFLFSIIIALFSCSEKAKTLNPEDLVTSGGGSPAPGYNYPFITGVSPLSGAAGQPTNTSFITTFNLPMDGATLTAANINILASITRTGNTTLGSNQVNNLSTTADLEVGMAITGTNIPAAATITVIVDANTIQLSGNATGTGAGVSLTMTKTLSEAAPDDYDIATNSTNSAIILTFNPFLNGTALSPIPAGFRVQVDFSTAILDNFNTPQQALTGTLSYNFTTGTSPDETDPVALTATRVPAPGATGIALSGAGISIDFDESVDVTSINSSTFYLEQGGNPIPVNYSYTAPTATITPAIELSPSTVYDVTVTTGIKDLAGNPIGAGTTWSFTTTAVPTDPTPGIPTLTGPDIVAVTNTTVQLSWSTNEATDYSIDYGRNDTFGSNSSSATYTVFHTADIASLTAGKRYYAQINYTDIVGNAGIPATKEFNTTTGETPTAIHDIADDQRSFYSVPARISMSPTGFFGFWTHVNGGTINQLYGQLYNNTTTAQWNAGSPMELFTNATYSYTFASASEDHFGGIIILVTSGSELYAKRITQAGGFYDWGGGADTTTAAGTGLLIINTAVAGKGYAVPVYNGSVTVRVSSTAEHNSLTFPNYLFEDDINIFSNVADSDIIYNTTSFTGTTIDTNSITPDLQSYIIGQDTSAVVTAGNTYIVGDSATTDAVTATDHTISGTQTNSGTKILYTQNYGAVPFWFGNNNIIYRNGVEYRSILTTTQISGPCGIHGASETIYQVEVDSDFAANIAAGNTFTVFERNTVIGTQTADTPPANPLYDDAVDFIAGGVTDGSIVLNHTTGSIEAVDTTTGPYTVNQYALDLSNPVMSDGDLYTIIDFTLTGSDATNVLSTGISTGGTAATIVDGSANFTGDGVSAGDVVYNITDDAYAMITAVAATTLTVDQDAQFTGGGDRYCVIDRPGVLFVWQEAGPLVRARVKSMNSNTPVNLTNEFTIGTNGQNPVALSNEQGDALVIYEETSGTPDKIRAALIDASGTSITNVELNNPDDGNESIVKVVSDGNGGAVVLFSTSSNNLYVQRVDSNGNLPWGPGATVVENDATVTAEQDMAYDSTNQDVIVVARVNNDIWAIRVGQTTTWGFVWISQDNPLNIHMQQNPKIFINGADTRIAWEDDRYSSYIGYGIFGMSIDAATGAKPIAWRANNPGVTGTIDENGIALVLNNYDDLYPTIDVVTYNDGSSSLLIWEDHRNNNGSDLVYSDFTGFAP